MGEGVRQPGLDGGYPDQVRMRWPGLGSLADPAFGQGGPRNFFRDFVDVAKQSQASRVSKYWPGSRARLRAMEALAFLTIKHAFSYFYWYFFFKFLCTFVWVTLQNIYFNMKDSGHFDKCNFWFLYLRKSRFYLFIWINLQIHYSKSQGSGTCLGPQKLLHF